jgi:glycosyltransferase involved in cell wall biosynthesis
VADRPKILVLVKGLGIGGAERLISEGSRFWDTDSFNYRVAYVLPWKDQLVPDLTSRGFSVECLGGNRPTIEAPLRLRRSLGRWRPDLIHAHLPSAGILARTTSLLPVVYTEHNVVTSYRPLTRWLNFATYGRNAAAIAVSDAVAASLAHYPGPDPVVVPNGVAVSVEPGVRARVRDELAVGPDRPLVVHVGNIRPWKGHRTLIEATARLRATVPDVLVVSIGTEKTEGDLRRVRLEADAADVGDTVRFLGRRSDAVDFIAAADVFVNPSDVEGLPLVVLEAMAVSTPVVATAVGGVPSIIHDDETGILVPPGQPEALAGAVAGILADPDRAAILTRRAHELAVGEYGIGRMVEANEAVYRAVIHG